MYLGQTDVTSRAIKVSLLSYHFLIVSNNASMKSQVLRFFQQLENIWPVGVFFMPVLYHASNNWHDPKKNKNKKTVVMFLYNLGLYRESLGLRYLDLFDGQIISTV